MAVLIHECCLDFGMPQGMITVLSSADLDKGAESFSKVWAPTRQIVTPYRYGDYENDDENREPRAQQLFRLAYTNRFLERNFFVNQELAASFMK
jgi:hypothetical protein